MVSLGESPIKNTVPVVGFMSGVGPANVQTHRVASKLAAGTMVEHDHRITNSTTKILIALAMTTGAASAQQHTLYDARGNVAGRSTADSAGTVTIYDAHGRVISRETTSGNTTTIYDDRGRNVGRFTTSR